MAGNARLELDGLLNDARLLRDLQITEQRYRALFEHPRDFIYVIEAVRDESGHIVDWLYVDANDRALDLLKHTRESLLGKRISEVLHERGRTAMARFARVVMKGEALHYETTFAEADFLVHLIPVNGDCLIGSGTEVTERNRAELEVQRLLEALRAEKEWLVAALDSINEEVYFTDPQKRYTYANPSAMRAFGHESVEGVDVETIVSGLVVLRPDGTPRSVGDAPPLRALKGEIVKDEEQVVLVPSTGEMRHREVSSAPVRNSEGEIIGSVSVVRDVTENRRAKARLHEAVAQARAAEAESRAALAAELAAMQRLHDLSTIAMTTDDQQALIEEILDATIALHGADCGSVQLFDTESKKLRVAAQRGLDRRFLERFASVGAGDPSTCGAALSRRERVVIEDLDADPTFANLLEFGREIGCRAVQSTPLFTTDGAPLGMLSTYFGKPRVFSQDELRLTDLYARQAGIAIERIRTEAALVAARESADHANKAKSHFVRAASHDLRQSVQTLAMLNASLRNVPMDETALATLRQQNEAVDTMVHLLDALLNISKLESGAVQPQVTDFPVESLFEKLRLEFSSHTAAKGLELRTEVESFLSIHSDPTLVGEVLRNLLSNAVKFTARGSILLRARRSGTAVRLEVVDTGIGIARDELPRIFGEFYQVGVDATVNREGYGLGLGIVQRLASLLHADIEVESEVGKGSRFVLTVPAGESEVRQREPRKRKTPIKSGSSATILLVEDDPSVRSSMELFFKVHGYLVLSAMTLDEALTIIGKQSPLDLLITDFHLPGGKTGSDVIRDTRTLLGDHFPVIMISGDTSSEVEELPHDARLRFASKPIEPDNLIALVEELLSSR